MTRCGSGSYLDRNETAMLIPVQSDSAYLARPGYIPFSLVRSFPSFEWYLQTMHPASFTLHGGTCTFNLSSHPTNLIRIDSVVNYNNPSAFFGMDFTT